MLNNNKISRITHLLIYLICSLVYSFSLDYSFLDDGLRHISFAKNSEIMISWGNVYPLSLFSSYDPWFGWHYLLSIILKIIPYEYIHIFVNTIVFFFLMVLIDLYIRKYSKYNFSTLLYIIVFIITMVTSFRYVMLRPDLLSGFYIMSLLLLRNKFRWTFIITLIYIPFYYLFFMYTGSIALVFLIQKKFKAFSGVLIGSIIGLVFHLLYDLNGYLDTVINILTDQRLRMGLAVKEGMPIFDFLVGVNYYILLPIFLGGSFLVILFKYNYFKSNTLSLFLLITSLLWINQHRYFHLFLPLIIVWLFIFIVNLNKKELLYLIRKYITLGKRYFNYSKDKKLFYMISIPYSILMLSIIFSSQSVNKVIEEGKYFTNKSFNYKTILSNKMEADMFIAHYHNPTLKLIPSCSIGWFKEGDIRMKKLYVKLQNINGTMKEEELKELILYTKTDYYLHYFGTSHKFNFEKLRILGIIPIEIDSKKVLFKINKEYK